MAGYGMNRGLCKRSRLLLDTHTFLWFIEDNPALSTRAKTVMEDDRNDLLVSVASLWEMAIKVSTGKLNINDATGQAQPLDPFIADQLRHNRINLLPITLEHVIRVSQLPYRYRDPFDRMLAAQSLVEGMPLLSVDAIMDGYGVTRLW